MEQFPSQFGINQVVDFVINGTRHTSTVRSIHFHYNKVRYDLDLWLKDDESSTRIYNVDSCFVEGIIFEPKAEVCDARDDE